VLVAWKKFIFQSSLIAKLSPMLVKELRQGLRRGIFLIPFMLIHLFAITALYLEFYSEVELGANRYTGVMQMGLFLRVARFGGLLAGYVYC
jgi:hypothetical protein